MKTAQLTADAIALLRQKIAIPSVSRDEKAAADMLFQWIEERALHPQRMANNVWAVSKQFDPKRKTILLNAHIDTVKPVPSWNRDPFSPTLTDDGIIYGLGSNDCGGGLVALLQAFIALNEKPQSYNLIYLASAEEEVSGQNGITLVLPTLPRIDVAIVGEPTGMQPATAEKGLMVIDMTAHGKAGHAARSEGKNAIYAMLDDLLWLRSYRFERISPLLGPTLMQATMVHAGQAHNVVPDRCEVVIDVRTNECYTNEEVFDIIRAHVKSDVKARSFRLSPSHISHDHPLVAKAIALGRTPFGSPTLSDQALMPFPSLKMGPGESSRSHTADEFIRTEEIAEAIELYIKLLDGLQL